MTPRKSHLQWLIIALMLLYPLWNLRLVLQLHDSISDGEFHSGGGGVPAKTSSQKTIARRSALRGSQPTVAEDNLPVETDFQEKEADDIDVDDIASESKEFVIDETMVDIDEDPSLRRTATRSGYDTSGHSRGIVLCLYNDIVDLGLSLIKELRCLGNQEPIQIHHCFPDEISEKYTRRILRSDSKVEIIDVCTEMVEAGKLDKELATTFRGYWIKPLALYHSSFQEVMLMDADDLFLKNPSILWENEGYQRTGTTFFHDRAINLDEYFNSKLPVDMSEIINWEYVQRSKAYHLRRWLELFLQRFPYKEYDLPPFKPSENLLKSLAWKETSCHEQDSSLVLFNKEKKEKALEILWFIMTKTRFEFHFSWGDKEAFWLACETAQTPYYFSPWGVAVLSSDPNKDMENHPESLCGSIVQYYPASNNLEEDDVKGMQGEVLYMNARAAIVPVPLSYEELIIMELQNFYNEVPTSVTKRQGRVSLPFVEHSMECLTGMGSIPLPDMFYNALLRRRRHYNSFALGISYGLDICE